MKTFLFPNKPSQNWDWNADIHYPSTLVRCNTNRKTCENIRQNITKTGDEGMFKCVCVSVFDPVLPLLGNSYTDEACMISVTICVYFSFSSDFALRFNKARLVFFFSFRCLYNLASILTSCSLLLRTFSFWCSCPPLLDQYCASPGGQVWVELDTQRLTTGHWWHS